MPFADGYLPDREIESERMHHAESKIERSRRFRVRIAIIASTILILSVLALVAVAHWLATSDPKRQVIRSLEKSGCSVTYEYQQLGSRPGRNWLSAALPQMHTDTVVSVSRSGSHFGDAIPIFDDAIMLKLALFPDLVDLRLDRTAISDRGVSVLAQLGSLRRLGLSHNRITRVKLSNMKDLECLDLSNTQINDASIASIAGSSVLQELDLSFTLVGDQGLGHLSELDSLRILRVNNCDISDAGLKHLSNCTALEILSIDCPKITQAGLIHILPLPKLRVLTLKSEYINEEAMKLIGKCQSLEHLELTDAPITDQGLAYLQSLRSLRVLRLRTTGDPDLGLISDLGMEYLSGLNTLQSLWLFGSGISDEGFSHLDNLHLLSEIVVRGTSISEEGLERSFDQSYFVQFAEPPTYTPSISRGIR